MVVGVLLCRYRSFGLLVPLTPAFDRSAAPCFERSIVSGVYSTPSSVPLRADPAPNAPIARAATATSPPIHFLLIRVPPRFVRSLRIQHEDSRIRSLGRFQPRRLELPRPVH